MYQRKQAIEKDLIDLVMGRKSSSEVKSSLDSLQNILTPRQNPGIGCVGGALVAAPGHSITFERGVVGVAAEHAGYNCQGEFFSSPTSAKVFSGIEFESGSGIVILSEEQATTMLKETCKKKASSLSNLKRYQLGCSIVKVKFKVAKFMETLVVYGSYKNAYTQNLEEGVDLGDAMFDFIKCVLEEYASLSTNEQKKYIQEWDLMAHGYDNASSKWNQQKFKNISQETKDSFDADVNAALLCRAVKDALFCFGKGVTKVDNGHTHYFNHLLNEVDAIYKE
jgi:hypothetical protein